jgi:hypothetical protein
VLIKKEIRNPHHMVKRKEKRETHTQEEAKMRVVS